MLRGPGTQPCPHEACSGPSLWNAGPSAGRGSDGQGQHTHPVAAWPPPPTLLPGPAERSSYSWKAPTPLPVRGRPDLTSFQSGLWVVRPPPPAGSVRTPSQHLCPGMHPELLRTTSLKAAGAGGGRRGASGHPAVLGCGRKGSQEALPSVCKSRFTPPHSPLQLGCIAEGGNPTNPKGWGPPHTGMRLPRPPGVCPTDRVAFLSFS